MSYKLIVGWLYPTLMSTYGDRGNIIVLEKRCQWRGIDVEIKKLDIGFTTNELKKCDLLFMGGAQDRQQKIVAKDLNPPAGGKKELLSKMIEQGTPGLYICGAYQFLGKYYKEADGTIIDGLGIFDLYTESPGENAKRLIGNIVIEVFGGLFDDLVGQAHETYEVSAHNVQLVGFENHGGRTYLGKGVKPLGSVKVGFGNNGTDKTEGAVYKNSIGSYLHGPILPKNPHLADWLITAALVKKYKKKIELRGLDDSLEWKARTAIAQKLGISI